MARALRPRLLRILKKLKKSQVTFFKGINLYQQPITLVVFYGVS